LLDFSTFSSQVYSSICNSITDHYHYIDLLPKWYILSSIFRLNKRTSIMGSRSFSPTFTSACLFSDKAVPTISTIIQWRLRKTGHGWQGSQSPLIKAIDIEANNSGRAKGSTDTLWSGHRIKAAARQSKKLGQPIVLLLSESRGTPPHPSLIASGWLFSLTAFG
jgi:hypothetical protein